ncbi:hypothetical protein DUNSADRAFT_15470, partial [Dunaliella salina]
MWGGFDFGLKEALEKAKHDFERSVDTALGIEETERRQQEEQKQAGRTGSLSGSSAGTPSKPGAHAPQEVCSSQASQFFGFMCAPLCVC